MLVVSAFLSLGLVAWTYSMFRQPKTSTGAAFLPAAGGLTAGVCLFPALLLHAVLVFPALIIWKQRQWPARTLLAYMVLAAMASYGVFTFSAIKQLVEVHRLRSEYAFESMESRVPEPPRRATGKLAKEAEEQLSQLENRVDADSNSFRKVMLERLHRDSVQSFIDSPGFGSGRGIRIPPSAETLKADLDHDGTSIPQPGPLSASIYFDEDLREAPYVKPEPLRQMHLDSVLNFANVRGFGLVMSRQKVAGFQAHQFNAVPRAKEWRVQTIELVGLLMHRDPVVYISNDLPRMDALRKAPTRALSSFETAGIAQLQKGDDLFIRETPETLRMLGAVRSVEQCIKCHGGGRGDLLGAFSYRLQRVL